MFSFRTSANKTLVRSGGDVEEASCCCCCVAGNDFGEGRSIGAELLLK